MPRLLEARPHPDHTLWLRYDDGTEGTVDLSHLAGRGVFTVLNDPEAFDRVQVGPGNSVS